jgi:hypothetical protein
MLTKEQILGANDRKIVKVFVPEWAANGMEDGESFVFVRTMTGAERDEFQASCLMGRTVNLRNATAKLVSLCICDQLGERVFSSNEAAQLGGRSSIALDRVADVARELNGLRAEDVESLAQNFGTTPSADSGSV